MAEFIDCSCEPASAGRGCLTGVGNVCGSYGAYLLGPHRRNFNGFPVHGSELHHVRNALPVDVDYATHVTRQQVGVVIPPHCAGKDGDVVFLEQSLSPIPVRAVKPGTPGIRLQLPLSSQVRFLNVNRQVTTSFAATYTWGYQAG